MTDTATRPRFGRPVAPIGATPPPAAPALPTAPPAVPTPRRTLDGPVTIDDLAVEDVARAVREVGFVIDDLADKLITAAPGFYVVLAEARDALRILHRACADRAPTFTEEYAA